MTCIKFRCSGGQTNQNMKHNLRESVKWQYNHLSIVSRWVCFLPLGNELPYILIFKLIALSSYQKVALSGSFFPPHSVSQITELAGVRRGLSFSFLAEFSASSFGDFVKSCGFNLSNREKEEGRGGGGGKKAGENGEIREWVGGNEASEGWEGEVGRHKGVVDVKGGEMLEGEAGVWERKGERGVWSWRREREKENKGRKRWGWSDGKMNGPGGEGKGSRVVGGGTSGKHGVSW